MRSRANHHASHAGEQRVERTEEPPCASAAERGRIRVVDECDRCLSAPSITARVGRTPARAASLAWPQLPALSGSYQFAGECSPRDIARDPTRRTHPSQHAYTMSMQYTSFVRLTQPKAVQLAA